MRDFTRWNRAGRRHINYVDGDAASFLDALRNALAVRFPDTWLALHDVEADIRGGAPLVNSSTARSLARYEAEPGDMGWEIARTFARACHVLAGHIDAYANEHFIESATQWECLRSLVAMLDYAPNPPASASTPIVLFAKAAGRIDVSDLQVSHTPPRGSAVVFENLEALELEPAFDAMRLAGFDRSAEFADIRDMVWELPESADAAIGELVFVEHGATGEGFATTIGWLENGMLTPATAPREAWPLADTRLSFAPKSFRRPLLDGERVICVDVSRSFEIGDVVAWRAGTDWRMAHVQVIDKGRLKLSTEPLPSVGTELFLAKPIADAEQARLPLDVQTFGWLVDGSPQAQDVEQLVVTTLKLTLSESSSLELHQSDSDTASDAMEQRWRTTTHAGTIYLVGGVDRPKTKVVESQPPGWLIFEGSPATWRTGAWFVGVRESGELQALHLVELTMLERGFRALFDGARTGSLLQIHGPFKHVLRPRGWNFDTRVVNGSTLVLDHAPGSALLGRRILLRGSGRSIHVANVVRRTGSVITLDPPLPAHLGLRAGEIVVHGNVVLFGHGERKPGQLLGSGDATRSNQRFVLAVEGVSFVADPSQASGVRADIELFVDGRRWTQVDALRDSGPTDEHYAVRMTEARQLSIETGDGVNGRRLPSGANNLRVELRVGTGLAGNVPAGSFKRLGKPHRLIEKLIQASPASGGNDMAGPDELRERAPGTVLALGRAVALDDFALLASGHASVWQARARHLPVSGAMERVEVLIVPAGGGELGVKAEDLADYLRARTLPDVQVLIRGYRERSFSLLVRVAVDELHYEAEQVLAAIRGVLERDFSLHHRRLGQSVELAEVVEAVETTLGVDHSGIVLDGNPEINTLVAAFDEVLVLGALELIATKQTIRTVGAAKQRRAIELRPVTIIQGVGEVRTTGLGSRLAGRRDDGAPPSEPARLHELAAPDSDRITTTLAPTLLREFVVKARLVTELVVPEHLIARLGARSLAELLDLDATRLSEHHRVDRAELLDLRSRLRTIQLCLDESAMDDIRLAEFSIVPDLDDVLPERPRPRQPHPLAYLPATIIAGVGLATARRLAAHPLDCLTVADIAYMRPERVVARVPTLRLANMWEIKRKAERLLELEAPSTLSEVVCHAQLDELFALEVGDLRRLSGLTNVEVEAFRRFLLDLELSLKRPPIPLLPELQSSAPFLTDINLATLFGVKP